MIENGDEKGDEMDDVFLNFYHIEDINMSIESSKKQKLDEDSEEFSSHPTY